MLINQAISSITGNFHQLKLSDLSRESENSKYVSKFDILRKRPNKMTSDPSENLTPFAKKLFSNLEATVASPFFNGQLNHCKYAPNIEGFTRMVFSITKGPEQDLHKRISGQFLNFQYHTQTRSYNENTTKWNKSFEIASKNCDAFFKNIFKRHKGIEMIELSLKLPIPDVLPITGSLQDCIIDQELINRIIHDIKMSEAKRLLGVCSKLEQNISGQINLRIMIFLIIEFIDDDKGFSDPDLIPKLKNYVELDNKSILELETRSLNGFIISNIFFKEIKLFQEQLKMLKTYVIGTEAFLRVGGIRPTFKIWYAKYKS